MHEAGDSEEYSEPTAVINVPSSSGGTMKKKRKNPGSGNGAGRPLELGAEREHELSEYLYMAGKYGYGLSRYEVLELTGEFVREKKIKTRWIKGTPGLDWLRSFTRRFSSIITHKDDIWSKQDDDTIDEYRFLQDLEKLYQDENVTSEDASRIYSLLEVTFPCEEHYVQSWEILQGNEEFKTSVLTCICANGVRLNPLVVFRGNCSFCERKVSGGSSMFCNDQALFCYWFENIFIQNLPRNGRSTILFCEGISLWVNLRVLKLAKRNNIIIVKFPPKIADRFLPLVSSYSPALKSAYSKLMQRVSQEEYLNEKDAEKKNFGNVVGKIWEESVQKASIVKGFEKTGLFPIGRTKIFENGISEPPIKKLKENNVNDEITENNQSEVEEMDRILIPRYLHSLPDSEINKAEMETLEHIESDENNEDSIFHSPEKAIRDEFPNLKPSETMLLDTNACEKDKISHIADLNGEKSSVKKTLKDGAVDLIKKAVEVIDNCRRSRQINVNDVIDDMKISTIETSVAEH